MLPCVCLFTCKFLVPPYQNLNIAKTCSRQITSSKTQNKINNGYAHNSITQILKLWTQTEQQLPPWVIPKIHKKHSRHEKRKEVFNGIFHTLVCIPEEIDIRGKRSANVWY
jgi:hypothetical protein